MTHVFYVLLTLVVFRTAGPGRTWDGEVVSAESWIGLAVAVGLVLYLLASLLFTERF